MVFNIPRVCDPMGVVTIVGWVTIDILCTQLYYICFIRVLDEGHWVIMGCCKGSQYKTFNSKTAHIQAIPPTNTWFPKYTKLGLQQHIGIEPNGVFVSSTCNISY